jgi:hypothetical protein
MKDSMLHFAALLVAATATVTAAHDAGGHVCVHDALNSQIHELTSTAEARFAASTSRQLYNINYDPHGRVLQSTFNNIRITVDLSRLYNDGNDTTSYVWGRRGIYCDCSPHSPGRAVGA